MMNMAFVNASIILFLWKKKWGKLLRLRVLCKIKNSTF